MNQCPFISKSDLSIATNISNTGVVMGSTDTDKKNAVVSLRDIEGNRMIDDSINSENKQVPISNIEDEDLNEVDEVLGHICCDLIEDMDENGMNQISKVPTNHLKNKKVDTLKSKGKCGQPPKTFKETKDSEEV